MAISNIFLCDTFLLFATNVFRVALEPQEPRVQLSDKHLCPPIHSVRAGLGQCQDISERNCYTSSSEIFKLVPGASDS